MGERRVCVGWLVRCGACAYVHFCMGMNLLPCQSSFHRCPSTKTPQQRTSLSTVLVTIHQPTAALSSLFLSLFHPNGSGRPRGNPSRPRGLPTTSLVKSKTQEVGISVRVHDIHIQVQVQVPPSISPANAVHLQAGSSYTVPRTAAGPLSVHGPRCLNLCSAPAADADAQDARTYAHPNARDS